MGPKQLVQRDLSLVLQDLQKLESAGKLDPVVAALLRVIIQLVESLKHQVRRV